MHGFWTSSCELLGALLVNKLHIFTFTFLYAVGDGISLKNLPVKRLKYELRNLTHNK